MGDVKLDCIRAIRLAENSDLPQLAQAIRDVLDAIETERCGVGVDHNATQRRLAPASFTTH